MRLPAAFGCRLAEREVRSRACTGGLQARLGGAGRQRAPGAVVHVVADRAAVRAVAEAQQRVEEEDLFELSEVLLRLLIECG